MNDNNKQAAKPAAPEAPLPPSRDRIRQDKFSTLRLACFRTPAGADPS